MLDVNGDGYPGVSSSASHGNRTWWNENPGARDLNGDGTLDLAMGRKTGLYLFENLSKTVANRGSGR